MLTSELIVVDFLVEGCVSYDKERRRKICSGPNRPLAYCEHLEALGIPEQLDNHYQTTIGSTSKSTKLAVTTMALPPESTVDVIAGAVTKPVPELQARAKAVSTHTTRDLRNKAGAVPPGTGNDSDHSALGVFYHTFITLRFAILEILVIILVVVLAALC
jgi:hypothetical protein